MIQSRMESFAVKERVGSTDAYGQLTNSYNILKTIEASISLATQKLIESDARYIDSTHIGLTFDKDLRDGQLLSNGDKEYFIKLVNVDGRYTQLTLKEVI